MLLNEIFCPTSIQVFASISESRPDQLRTATLTFFAYCGLKAWQNRVEANVDLKKPI